MMLLSNTILTSYTGWAGSFRYHELPIFSETRTLSFGLIINFSGEDP